MRKKLETRQIIIGNAAIVLLFIAVLVAVNLFYFNRLNTSLSSINEIHNRKLDIISQMSRIVRDRSLIMLKMHLAEDFWYIDEQYMQFHSMAPEFIALRDRLRELPLSAEEQSELQRNLELINKTQPIQDEIVQRIHTGGDQQVLSDIMQKDMPLETRLWDGFNKLSQLVNANAENARNEANQGFRESLRIILVVAICLALFITMLMAHALRKIQKIEKKLIDRAESLGWEATHDPLTNIWNRRFLEYRVNQLISDEYPSGSQHMLIYIDLDNFKPINDIYGHYFGDKFLRAIAHSIEPCIRKNDTLARIGGDEFAVLLENCTAGKAGEIAECIRTSINDCCIDYDGQTISNDGCSIGIAACNEDLDSFHDLLMDADHACYTAKRAGKNRIMFAGEEYLQSA